MIFDTITYLSAGNSWYACMRPLFSEWATEPTSPSHVETSDDDSIDVSILKNSEIKIQESTEIL